MSARFAGLVLFGGLLALSAGNAQEQKGEVPSVQRPKTERAHYVVQNADPMVLARVVGMQFKGDAEIIGVPAGSGNAVLISGSSAVIPDVMKLLEQLDKKQRTIEVVVTLAEVPAKKDGTEVSPTDLAQAATLAKEGKGQQIKLTVTEGQQASSTTGGSKPYVSASTTVGGGFGRGGGGPPAAQRSINYREVGTTVRVTARIGSDNSISLDLNVQDSKVRPSTEENTPPSFDTSTLTTKLVVPAGKPVAAQTIRAEEKAGTVTTVVVVTARVVK